MRRKIQDDSCPLKGRQVAYELENSKKEKMVKGLLLTAPRVERGARTKR